jgi:cytochrome c oxidase assembly protein subunit 11
MSRADNHRSNRRNARRRDIAVAAACGVFVAFMVGMAYAAVPFYDWFCRATGFGGRTQVATASPSRMLDRKLTIRFDGNVTAGLPWRFAPEQTTVDVRIGEVVTAYYTVVNEAARETLGQASYNVTPPTTGLYFQKINCFCFTEQRLRAGEKREMAVVFYIDPQIIDDAEQTDLNTITLSYTFYPLRQPANPVAQTNDPGERSQRLTDSQISSAPTR